MTENAGGHPPLSVHGSEAARILRMFGARPGQQVRAAMLEALWARHHPRGTPEQLRGAIAELVRAGVVRPGKPDGVVMAGGSEAAG